MVWARRRVGRAPIFETEWAVRAPDRTGGSFSAITAFSRTIFSMTRSRVSVRVSGAGSPFGVANSAGDLRCAGRTGSGSASALRAGSAGFGLSRSAGTGFGCAAVTVCVCGISVGRSRVMICGASGCRICGGGDVCACRGGTAEGSLLTASVLRSRSAGGVARGRDCTSGTDLSAGAFRGKSPLSEISAFPASRRRSAAIGSNGGCGGTASLVRPGMSTGRSTGGYSVSGIGENGARGDGLRSLSGSGRSKPDLIGPVSWTDPSKGPNGIDRPITPRQPAS